MEGLQFCKQRYHLYQVSFCSKHHQAIQTGADHLQLRLLNLLVMIVQINLLYLIND